MLSVYRISWHASHLLHVKNILYLFIILSIRNHSNKKKTSKYVQAFLKAKLDLIRIPEGLSLIFTCLNNENELKGASFSFNLMVLTAQSAEWFRNFCTAHFTSSLIFQGTTVIGQTTITINYIVVLSFLIIGCKSTLVRHIWRWGWT